MSPAAGVAVLRLATRGSALARAQAGLAAAALEAGGGGASARLVIVTTGGDRNRTTPIEQMEGQGWFTAEIERALLDGGADVAVHAAKDLPTTLAPGLEVVALLPRGNPADALVTRDGAALRLAAGWSHGGQQQPAPFCAAPGAPPRPALRAHPRQRRHPAAQARRG